jgi:hypothetical protein
MGETLRQMDVQIKAQEIAILEKQLTLKKELTTELTNM